MDCVEHEVGHWRGSVHVSDSFEACAGSRLFIQQRSAFRHSASLTKCRARLDGRSSANVQSSRYSAIQAQSHCLRRAAVMVGTSSARSRVFAPCNPGQRCNALGVPSSRRWRVERRVDGAQQLWLCMGEQEGGVCGQMVVDS